MCKYVGVRYYCGLWLPLAECSENSCVLYICMVHSGQQLHLMCASIAHREQTGMEQLAAFWDWASELFNNRIGVFAEV